MSDYACPIVEWEVQNSKSWLADHKFKDGMKSNLPLSLTVEFGKD